MDVCPLCMDEYTQEHQGIEICMNNHKAHAECIKSWAEKSKFCPVEGCNAKLKDDIRYPISSQGIAFIREEVDEQLRILANDLLKGSTNFEDIKTKVDNGTYPVQLLDLFIVSPPNSLLQNHMYSKPNLANLYRDFLVYKYTNNIDLTNMRSLSDIRSSIMNIIFDIQKYTMDLSPDQKEDFKTRLSSQFNVVNNRISELVREYNIQHPGNPTYIPASLSLLSEEERRQPPSSSRIHNELGNITDEVMKLYMYAYRNDRKALNRLLEGIIVVPTVRLRPEDIQIQPQNRIDGFWVGFIITIAVYIVVMYVRSGKK